MNMRQILRVAPVIPVVTLDDATRAVPLARALEQGGIPIIEITLRTPAAIEGIRAIKRELPDILVGAGTIWGASELGRVVEAGADFGVSPGATPALLDAAADQGLPFLPGAQTASEIAALVERGYQAVKFFPAEAAGGVAALKSLAAVFPALLFCPTGGIRAETAAGYREIANVPTVGGSWLAPEVALRDGDYEGIELRARQAATADLPGTPT